MPARTQSTCYPSQAIASSGSKVPPGNSPVCTICNADDQHIQEGCQGGNTKTFFDAGCKICNTVCITVQNYCGGNAGTTQYIKDHSDVGPYTSICEAKDEFIFRNWTAAWWNDYQDDLLTGDKMGLEVSHSAGVSFPNGRAVADPKNYPHPGGSLVTADKYNDLVKALAKFSSTIASVQGAAQVGCENATVIRAQHAKALHTGYDKAQFKTTVCDVCNAAIQRVPSGCQCVSASCMCSCGCDNPSS